jgi:hypothetical protein
MQIEKQIREGFDEAKAEINRLNNALARALIADDNDKIAECASLLGMLGNCFAAVIEILK